MLSSTSAAILHLRPLKLTKFLTQLQCHEQTGMSEKQINFDRDSLVYLIDKHCRESGVRNLQKKIERIFRKSARKGEKVDIAYFIYFFEEFCSNISVFS